MSFISNNNNNISNNNNNSKSKRNNGKSIFDELFDLESTDAALIEEEENCKEKDEDQEKVRLIIYICN